MATCNCKFGTTPDKLKVLTQNKHYINEEEPKEKLVATTADIGSTFEKNTFGLCKLQPTDNSFKSCQAVVTQWSGAHEEVTYEINNGHPLLEDSKGTCPIVGTDCIDIINHGQVAEITMQNLLNARPEVMDILCPLLDFTAFRNEVLTKPNIIEAYFTDLQGNKIDLGEDEQEVYLVIEGENLSGLTMDFSLDNKGLDFKYKGNILENDTLKDYAFTNDTKEQIPLTVINTKK